MKKIIILLVCMVSALTGWSQVSFGLKAGVNIANQSFTYSGVSITPKSVVGFHGGAYVNIKIKSFGIQPEAYFSMQGSKVDIGGDVVESNFNYLSIPILFRYNVTDFLNLHVGPQFGVLLSAKATANGDTQDVKDDIETLDFGVAAGVGVDLPFGLNGGVRYVAGLTNIDKSADNDESAKNRTFQIYVGYRIVGK